MTKIITNLPFVNLNSFRLLFFQDKLNTVPFNLLKINAAVKKTLIIHLYKKYGGHILPMIRFG